MHTSPVDYQAALERIVNFFSHITRQHAEQIELFYSDDAYFKDPFNEVQGIAQVKHIFLHMFAQVDEPRFLITETLLQDNRAVLIWQFDFQVNGALRHAMPVQQKILGSTHLRFNEQGKVCYHRDYWDAAEELYEKLPILKYLMRGLKRAANR